MTSHEYSRWCDAQGQNGDTDDDYDLLAEAESLHAFRQAEAEREINAWLDSIEQPLTDDELEALATEMAEADATPRAA